ncbi:hypothetical protein FPV67DRAFT_1457518 [Lyophyllum atratum]|nr:hypothetical protein FPV67DRAFT_1457518 [Lyophyllum atratum]
MPNFQGAHSVGLEASPMHDIAGNNNIQSSPSNNVNCGNTTNNITSNANNNSSINIGGTNPYLQPLGNRQGWPEIKPKKAIARSQKAAAALRGREVKHLTSPEYFF